MKAFDLPKGYISLSAEQIGRLKNPVKKVSHLASGDTISFVSADIAFDGHEYLVKAFVNNVPALVPITQLIVNDNVKPAFGLDNIACSFSEHPFELQSQLAYKRFYVRAITTVVVQDKDGWLTRQTVPTLERL